ncbi:MAG: tyrosine-type recombinase/integrase [Chloroflexota bacterium]
MAIKKIERRKGTIYRVRLLIDGRRVSKNFSRKYDAMQFEQNARLDHRVVTGATMKFKAAALDWFENHAKPRKAPGTVVNNEALIRNDLIPRFGKMLLADIAPQHIDTFIAELRTRMSNASVNRRLELIRAIFNYHIRRRSVCYNPMDGVAFLKVDPKAMKFWALKEARNFLEHAKAKYEGTDRENIYVLYALALNTGMRLGEILALKWSAVDFKNGLITVCRTLCHHTQQVRETTKGRRIRHVPINDALYSSLKRFWAARGGVPWVFHTNGKLLDQSNFRNRYWEVDKREAEVTNIRFHDLRHTYASHFMMNGGDVFKLQAILGHADIRTTMQYSHFSKAYIQENANIVQFKADENVVSVDFQRRTANHRGIKCL